MLVQSLAIPLKLTASLLRWPELDQTGIVLQYDAKHFKIPDISQFTDADGQLNIPQINDPERETHSYRFRTLATRRDRTDLSADPDPRPDELADTLQALQLEQRAIGTSETHPGNTRALWRMLREAQGYVDDAAGSPRESTS